MIYKQNYGIGDRVSFDGCGPDGFSTDTGTVIFVNDSHIIVQIEYMGPYAASGFNRIGLPYETVTNIIGKEVPHNEYDMFVDLLDDISLYYEIDEDFLEDNTLYVVFSKKENCYYYKMVDYSNSEDETEDWFAVSVLSIKNDLNNLICVEYNGDTIPYIHTWCKISQQFGRTAAYELMKNGVFQDKESNIIKIFKPIREN